MKLKQVPSDSATLSSALPRMLGGAPSSGRAGALLIHGFTGTPRDLEPLGVRLQEAGLIVSIPRLPGHGTNGKDFLQSGWRDWLRASLDAYLDLRARCETVHLVGFSMGGLLAVLLASRFPVQRLLLLAPALQARNPLLPFTPLLSLFLKRVPWAVTTAQEITDPDYAIQAREYWRWRFLPQAASLFRLQRMARRAVPRLRADILAIVGAEDRSVPLSVLERLETRATSARVRGLVVEKGTHLILGGASGGRVIDAAERWLVDGRAGRAKRRASLR